MRISSYPPRDQEWLVTDHHGLFSIGTAAGIRTRKYHSFLSGISGRLDTNFVGHLELLCNGQTLWDETSDESEKPRLIRFRGKPWPQWTWKLTDGALSVEFLAAGRGEFKIEFQWTSGRNKVAQLVMRPYLALRALHDTEPQIVDARREDTAVHFKSRQSGAEVWMCSNSTFDWQPEAAPNSEAPSTNEQGLYCPGQFAFELRNGEYASYFISTATASIAQDEDATETDMLPRIAPTTALDTAHALTDFLLYEPAGVAAGFPWLAERGRDTFIALPGIVGGVFEQDARIRSWAIEVLDRWGEWIEKQGMLPSVITKKGPEWTAADITLWWTHALASLWVLALAKPSLGLLEVLPKRFEPLLAKALETISHNRHAHLRQTDDGLLEVTTEYTTWMDSGSEGVALPPRVGVLPEINALWIQARCLHALWKKKKRDAKLFSNAELALSLAREETRPNIVFLHSLPLAPSFITNSEEWMRRDAALLVERFLTPVGLRSMVPNTSGSYAYPNLVWGWLKGQFEVAAQRFVERKAMPSGFSAETDFPPLSTIDGHVSELFDGAPPWAPRGMPAQAASLACQEEAKIRQRWGVDEVVRKIIRTHFQQDPDLHWSTADELSHKNRTRS